MISIYNIKKGNIRVTSPYGYRNLNGVRQWHGGIDLVCDINKEIVSCVDGVVVYSGIITNKANLTWQWGNHVIIEDSKKVRYYYCHLKSLKVKANQKVKAGDIIGVEGSTGYSFGSHCHFEIRKGNLPSNTINPADVLGISNKVGAYSYDEDEHTNVIASDDKKNITVNSKVKMIGKKWATGENVPKFVKDNVYDVIQIKPDRYLLGIDKIVTGWANKDDVVKVK